MTTSDITTTLTTLLMALAHPEVELSAKERDRLYDVGDQLDLDPEDWEFIHEGISGIITRNESLKTAYQSAENQLQGKNIKDLLPTENELSVDLEKGSIERRGSDDDYNTNTPEIVKLAIKCLRSNNPLDKARKLKWLDRLNQKL
jgi:hypothetical protein